MPTPWEDPPGAEAQIVGNAARVLRGIAAARPGRPLPTVSAAQQWHRDLYEGIAKPHLYYAGEVRDTDHRFPDLIGYEVAVGPSRGVPSAEVPRELSRFEEAARLAATRLDAAIPPAHASLSAVQLHGVISLAAILHGEWVRIHPFANGNGRTARLWANWALLRYELPPAITIKPRPPGAYGAAALASMLHDHAPTVALFHALLASWQRPSGL